VRTTGEIHVGEGLGDLPVVAQIQLAEEIKVLSKLCDAITMCQTRMFKLTYCHLHGPQPKPRTDLPGRGHILVDDELTILSKLRDDSASSQIRTLKLIKLFRCALHVHGPKQDFGVRSTHQLVGFRL